jgi:glycosyltransferase involved in cell wall biosynthesis
MVHPADRAPGGAPAPAAGLRLLVAIPALNEERTVGGVVRGIPRDLDGVGSVDVLVVDDGSTDRTAEEAEAAGARVIHHATPRGVGASFASSLRYAIDRGADLVVSIDADGQFDPADIRALIRPVVADEADFASASRFADPALVPEMPALKLWGNRVMARLVSRLAGQSFCDVSCGMRCYGRRALLSLNPIGRFTYTQEVFLNLAFKQLRIVEVPVAVRGEREFGQSRVAGNLWTYALKTSGIIFRCYRDYHPLRFFGAFALVMMAVAFALGGFLTVHYLTTGSFTPHKWAGFTSGALFILALLVLMMGIIGDMLNRHRIYLEELLYHRRVQASPASAPDRRSPAADEPRR